MFYVPLVYVNMNKGTFSLVCYSQWAPSVYSRGTLGAEKQAILGGGEITYPLWNLNIFLIDDIFSTQCFLMIVFYEEQSVLLIV